MSARDDVLARVRRALGPSPSAPEVPRGYHQAGASRDGDAVARFCERAAEYTATVTRCGDDALAAVLGARARAHGVTRLACPAATAWAVDGAETVPDDPPLDPRTLDSIGAVVTGSALAIADTGTVVLDGGPASGRRALSLVPDVHLCVVRAATVVWSVPDAIAALAADGARGRPVTFISGPSATSDIELQRVEGVHGPRTLEIVVVDEAP